MISHSLFLPEITQNLLSFLDEQLGIADSLIGSDKMDKTLFRNLFRTLRTLSLKIGDTSIYTMDNRCSSHQRFCPLLVACTFKMRMAYFFWNIILESWYTVNYAGERYHWLLRKLLQDSIWGLITARWVQLLHVFINIIFDRGWCYNFSLYLWIKKLRKTKRKEFEMKIA